MANLNKNRIFSVLPAILTLVGVVLISSNKYFVFLATLSTINAIAILGIVIISGLAGQLNLGQSAFVGLGAYSGAIMACRWGLPFWAAIPVTLFVAGLWGALMGVPALRLKGGPYLALVTQTFGEMVYLIIMNLEKFTGGPFGLLGIPYPKIFGYEIKGGVPYMYLSIFFLIVCYWTCQKISKSSVGLVLNGIRESEDAEQSLGINTIRYKITAFVLSAMLGGISGLLYAPFVGYISPDQFRWNSSLLLVSGAIIGGMKSFGGVIVGAVVITCLPEALRLSDQYRMILYGLLVIFCLALLPDGIASLYGKNLKEIWAMFRKRCRELARESK